MFIPLSLVVFGSVPPADVPKASAMFNLSRQLGGSLATALLVMLLVRSTAAHQTRIAADITSSHTATASYLDARGGVHSPRALVSLNAVVETQATVLGYADTNRYSALVTFLLMPLVLFLKKPAHPSGMAIE